MAKLLDTKATIFLKESYKTRWDHEAGIRILSTNTFIKIPRMKNLVENKKSLVENKSMLGF